MADQLFRVHNLDKQILARDAAKARQQALGRVGLVEVNGNRMGNCFLVNSDLILTAFHVVKDAENVDNITVAFDFTSPEKRTLNWISVRRIRCRSEETDLDYALLELVESQQGRGAFVPCSRTSVGQPVYVLGHPRTTDGGFSPLTIADGHITSINRQTNRIAHVCTTDNGSSGSPLLNIAGNVIGIHHAGNAGQGNFAIPMTSIAKHINDRNSSNPLLQFLESARRKASRHWRRPAWSTLGLLGLACMGIVCIWLLDTASDLRRPVAIGQKAFFSILLVTLPLLWHFCRLDRIFQRENWSRKRRKRIRADQFNRTPNYADNKSVDLKAASRVFIHNQLVLKRKLHSQMQRQTEFRIKYATCFLFLLLTPVAAKIADSVPDGLETTAQSVTTHVTAWAIRRNPNDLQIQRASQLLGPLALRGAVMSIIAFVVFASAFTVRRPHDLAISLLATFGVAAFGGCYVLSMTSAQVELTNLISSNPGIGPMHVAFSDCSNLLGIKVSYAGYLAFAYCVAMPLSVFLTGIACSVFLNGLLVPVRYLGRPKLNRQ